MIFPGRQRFWVFEPNTILRRRENSLLIRTKIWLILWLWCLLLPPLWGARIGLYGESEEARGVADLVMAEYGGEFDFLERQELDQILRERRLRLNLLSEDLSMQPLVSLDLLSILEMGQDSETSAVVPGRLIVFDQHTGFRLLNRRLPTDLQAAVKEVGGILAEAVRMSGQQEHLRTLSLVSVRNAGVPEHLEAEIRQLEADLERLLHYLPETMILERDHLEKYWQEKLLNPHLPALPPSRLLLRVEMSAESEPQRKFSTVLRLTDAANQVLFELKFEGADRADTRFMLEELSRFLELPLPAGISDAVAESRRFYDEFFYFKRLNQPERALKKGYSCIALEPHRVNRRAWVTHHLTHEDVFHVTPEKSLETLGKVLAFWEEIPTVYATYHYCHLASMMISILRRNYRNWDKIRPATREKFRQWTEANREIFLPYLRWRNDVAVPEPQTVREAEYLAYAVLVQCSPALYFDDLRFLDDAVPKLIRLSEQLSRFPDADIGNRYFGGRPILAYVVFTRLGRGSGREHVSRLSKKLVESRHPEMAALGLTLELMQKTPGASVAELDSLLEDHFVRRRELAEQYGHDRIEFKFFELLPELQVRLNEMQYGYLPSGDPRRRKTANLSEFFTFLQKSRVSAVQLHGPPWKKIIGERFSRLTPAMLQPYNPDYRIAELPRDGQGRILHCFSDSDDNCFLVSLSDQEIVVEEYLPPERRTRVLYAVPRSEEDAGSEEPVTGSSAEGCIAIGLANRVYLYEIAEKKHRFFTFDPSFKIQSTLIKDQRLYVFLGPAGGDSRIGTVLQSCHLAGGDLVTHISTLRDMPKNELEDPQENYQVEFIGQLPGKRDLFLLTPFGFWQYDLDTDEAEIILIRPAIDVMRHHVFLYGRNIYQQGEKLIFSALFSRGSIQDILFIEYDLRNGSSRVLGCGPGLEDIADFTFSDRAIISGQFRIEKDNFWCTGERDGMMLHLRLDDFEHSPRLLFPKVDNLFPGANSNSIVAVHGDQLWEIRYLPKKKEPADAISTGPIVHFSASEPERENEENSFF